jgi:hypothetical protein
MTTNGVVSLRPFVVLAIRMMAPGRRRVQMVKLAHAMTDARADFGHSPVRLVAVDGRPQVVPSQQHAA